MKQNILYFKLFVQNTLYLDLKPKLTILCCKYFCEATNPSRKNNILLFLVLLYSLISHKQLTKKSLWVSSCWYYFTWCLQVKDTCCFLRNLNRSLFWIKTARSTISEYDSYFAQPLSNFWWVITVIVWCINLYVFNLNLSCEKVFWIFKMYCWIIFGGKATVNVTLTRLTLQFITDFLFLFISIRGVFKALPGVCFLLYNYFHKNLHCRYLTGL